MDIVILPTKNEHVVACLELDSQLGLPAWTAAAYQALIHDADCDFLVAVAAGRVAGYYLARGVGESGEIFKLGVRRTVQRRGVGRELLRCGLRAARRRHWKECFLEVRAGNRAALQFYYEHGFARVGERKAYYQRPVEDAIVLSLQLEGITVAHAVSVEGRP